MNCLWVTHVEQRVDIHCYTDGNETSQRRRHIAHTLISVGVHTVVIKCHLKVRREHTSPLSEENPNRTDQNDNSVKETDDRYHSLKARARETPVTH